MITYTNIGSNGRLGNQLFQYAAAKSAALKNNSLFAIPLENHKLFEYFDLECKKYSLVQNENVISKLRPYSESIFNYDKKFEEITDNTNLFGYFQTEKYFVNYKNEIAKDFCFKEETLEKAKSFIDNLKKDKKIISMHVRRTDYVNLQNFHPLCTMEYYREAMSVHGDVYFLIFSDDIEWCKQNFIGNQFLFSESNSEIVDLCIMSLCDGNIIANSSYSWWGAWLNKNNKLVIAPKKWFGDSYKDKNTDDVYCEGWIKI